MCGTHVVERLHAGSTHAETLVRRHHLLITREAVLLICYHERHREVERQFFRSDLRVFVPFGRGAVHGNICVEGGGLRSRSWSRGRQSGKGCKPAVDGGTGRRGLVTWLQKLGLATAAPVELLAALSYTPWALSRRLRPLAGLLCAVDGVCPGGRGNATRPDVSSLYSSS